MVHTCISYSASIRFVAVYSSTQSSCSSKINGTDSLEQIRSCLTGRVVNWRTAFTWRWRERCFMWSASVKSFFFTCAVRSVAYCKTPILPMRLSRVIVVAFVCERSNLVAYCFLCDTFICILKFVLHILEVKECPCCPVRMLPVLCLQVKLIIQWI